jgi:hypothetical protein
MNYVILRNGTLVFVGGSLSDCQTWMTANKASFSESDVLYLFKLDKTANISTTVTYS